MACLKLLNHSSHRDTEQECTKFTLPSYTKVLSHANLKLALKHAYHLLTSLITKELCLKSLSHSIPNPLVTVTLLFPWTLKLPWQWVCL